MSEHFSAEHGSTIKREQIYHTQGSASVVRCAPIDGWCFAADEYRDGSTVRSIHINREGSRLAVGMYGKLYYYV